MRTVTFNEMVPGMVLYCLRNVKREIGDADQRNLRDHIILQRIVHPGEERSFWGDSRAMYYLDLQDPHMGICSTASWTGDDYEWLVIDDEETLSKIRAHVKANINRQRDHLTECERLVDANC